MHFARASEGRSEWRILGSGRGGGGGGLGGGLHAATEEREASETQVEIVGEQVRLWG